jgi:hypothetical protein
MTIYGLIMICPIVSTFANLLNLFEIEFIMFYSIKFYLFQYLLNNFFGIVDRLLKNF